MLRLGCRLAVFCLLHHFFHQIVGGMIGLALYLLFALIGGMTR